MLPQVYHKSVDKSEFYTPGVMGDKVTAMVQILNHKEHSLRRRIIAPLVSEIISTH